MWKNWYFDRPLTILAFLILVVACNSSSSSQAQSDYDKLCVIFKETLHKNISSDMQEFEIVDRALKEVPNISNIIEKISNVSPKEAYPLYKKFAERATNKPWDCQVMKDFYAGKYSNK